MSEFMPERFISALYQEDSNEIDIFSLINEDQEEEINNEDLPETLPILPLKNMVLFPGMVVPITVGRDKSIKLVRDANKSAKNIGTVAQRDINIEDPLEEDLSKVGTVASILRLIKMPDGTTTVLLRGKRRFNLEKIVQTDPYLSAQVSSFEQSNSSSEKETQALIDTIKETAVEVIQLNPFLPSEAINVVKSIKSPQYLLNFVSSNMNAEISVKQDMLEMADFTVRATALIEHLNREKQMLELKNQIQNKVRGDMDKQQREFFLQQQMRAIQEELGGDSPERDIENLNAAAKQKMWSETVAASFKKELDRLRRINPMAPDYSIQIAYLQLLLDLPWNEVSSDNFDLKNAEMVLEEDHFGLEKVKRRILEYLAVLKLKGDMKSPILCLYGPPGVGKTSLGKSIAKALGRKYSRMALGGLHDESEIRGHRRTYIGAMPGRIIQSLKKVKTANPVFVLDEIDKIQMSFRGDPSSALLEVLDPEQNSTFYDNYVEIEYDLSKVMFIATANSLDSIQPALLDRMEIIEINGYTLEEKIQIAKKYLIPKQKKNHGLMDKDFAMNDKAIEKVIEHYTRESGVRGLDKQMASIARFIAREKVTGNKYKKSIDENLIEKILGIEKIEKETYQDNSVAGVVTGLAWTSVGGEILFVESRITKGNGKLTLTGQLGDVMKESAQTALTFLKSQANKLEINPNLFEKFDIHIHVPAGAVPKDGPSAGVTMLTSLASVFTQRKVRSNLAMTGEITLRGKVLPIGGVKEKILAAKRAGITDILLCESNRKDVSDIQAHYLEGLNFHYVSQMEEVLNFALLNEKVNQPIQLEQIVS